MIIANFFGGLKDTAVGAYCRFDLTTLSLRRGLYIDCCGQFRPASQASEKVFRNLKMEWLRPVYIGNETGSNAETCGGPGAAQLLRHIIWSATAASFDRYYRKAIVGEVMTGSRL